MATSKIPPHAQLSAAAEYRHKMLLSSMHRLQHLAWKAINVRGLKNTDFVVVCIQVDSRWRSFVDLLMPGEDWDSIRAKGAEPIAQGSALMFAAKMIAEELPDLTGPLLEAPLEGKVKAIVLSDKGDSVYDIDPKEDVMS